MMKALIVGGTSSVAKYLAKELSGVAEVTTAGRTGCDVFIDLDDIDGTLVLPEGIDVVINAAAHFGGKSDSDIVGAIRVNVMGVLKLAQAAVKAGVKQFVSISSIFARLDFDSPHYSVYALSKRQSDELLTYYCKIHSLPLTILRPSQIYGNEEWFAKHQPFFYMMVDSAKKGKDILLYGSNDPKRNYIHIEDLTAVITKVIFQKVEGNFSVSHPQDVTYSQIANAAIQAFESESKVRFLTEKPDIPNNVFAKDDSLYERISFYPQISIIEGLKKIANYKG